MEGRSGHHQPVEVADGDADLLAVARVEQMVGYRALEVFVVATVGHGEHRWCSPWRFGSTMGLGLTHDPQRLRTTIQQSKHGMGRDDVDSCPTGKRLCSWSCSGFAVGSDFVAPYDYYDPFSEGRAAGGDFAVCPGLFDYHGLHFQAWVAGVA